MSSQKSIWQEIRVNKLFVFTHRGSNSIIITKSNYELSDKYELKLAALLLLGLFTFFASLFLVNIPYNQFQGFYYDGNYVSIGLLIDIFLLAFWGRLFYMFGRNSITGFAKIFIESMCYYCGGFIISSIGLAVYLDDYHIIGYILFALGILSILLSFIFWKDHSQALGEWKHFTKDFRIGDRRIAGALNGENIVEDIMDSLSIGPPKQQFQFLIIKEDNCAGLFEFKGQIPVSQFKLLFTDESEQLTLNYDDDFEDLQ
jgi:hypothetical protein